MTINRYVTCPRTLSRVVCSIYSSKRWKNLTITSSLKFCIDQTKSQVRALKWTLSSHHKHRIPESVLKKSICNMPSNCATQFVFKIFIETPNNLLILTKGVTIIENFNGCRCGKLNQYRSRGCWSRFLSMLKWNWTRVPCLPNVAITSVLKPGSDRALPVTLPLPPNANGELTTRSFMWTSFFKD